jgi:hypothetical protein
LLGRLEWRTRERNEQLDDVRMTEQLEVLDLPLYASSHVHVKNLLAVDDLHGDLVAGDRMDSD